MESESVRFTGRSWSRKSESEGMVIFFTFGVGVSFESVEKPESDSGVGVVFFLVLGSESDVESKRFKSRESESARVGSRSRSRINSVAGVDSGVRVE